MDENTETIEEIEKRMRRAGAFHPDDLPFNQLGELSQRQKRWLMLEIGGWGVQIAIEVALIIFAWVLYYLQAEYDAKSVWWLGGLVWSVFLGIAIVMCVQNMRSIWADITENEVKSISGIISKNLAIPRTTTRKGAIANWTIEIRDHQFSIHQFIYDSLIDRQRYRVFYTPTLQRVINIEPLFDLNNVSPD